MDEPKPANCRICLGPLEFPQNLFDGNFKKLLELLHKLLGFEVYVQGGVFNVCAACEGKLNWVVEFQSLCEKSLERFRDVEYKKEFIEIDEVDPPAQVIDEPDLFDVPLPSPDSSSSFDSDTPLDHWPKKRRKKTLVKRVTRSKRKVRKKSTDSTSDVPETKKIKSRCKQFPESEVLAAIAEFDSYMTDLRNRTCRCCDYVATTATTLRMHMSWKHKEFFKTWCKHCNIKVENLKRHMKTANCCENRCKFCKKICVKSDRLSDHLRTHCHKAFDDFKYVIEEDAKRLKQFPAEEVIAAIKEYESYMTDMKNRQCICCEYIGPTAKLLRMHMTRKHEEEFRNWCKNCNLRVDDLETHKDTVKCGEEKCKFCKKIFSNMKYFTQHLRTHCQTVKDNKHTEEARWKACEQYPKERVLIAIEESTHYMRDLKNRTCLYCDFIAPTARTLTVHMKFGHKEATETWCGRCNLQTDNLQIHFDTTKCFENRCVLCGKMFTKINRLTRHLESHCRDEFRKNELNIEWQDMFPQSVDNRQTENNGKSDDIMSPGNAWFKEDPALETPKLIEEQPVDIKGELKQESVLDRELTPSQSSDSADSDYEDTDKRGKKIGPLKQYSRKKVQEAITECMRGFYTNRKCVVCAYVTSNCKALANHMTSHKNIKNRWCSRCNTLPEHLNKHWKDHKHDILKCTFCGRSSENIEYLKDHLKRHCRGINFIMRPKWHSCQICPQSFPDEQQLKNHKCKEILGSAFCLLCKKRVGNLRMHMVHKHNPDLELGRNLKNDARKTLCPVCGKTFMKDRSLAAHMYTHTGDMPYKCSYCEKGFPNVSILRSHERRHVGVRSYVCHICGKGFVYANDHNKHVKTHEGGPVPCLICNKEFKRPGLLKLHMRRHTGENQYYCAYCGLSFHQKSLLLIHMSRHNKNKRPYKCSFCQKDFRNPNTLKKHEDIHRGIKPYKCSICFFSSTHSHVLKSHMKQHPEDAPQSDRPHKCLFCNRQFETNAMLMSHADIYHRDAVQEQKYVENEIDINNDINVL